MKGLRLKCGNCGRDTSINENCIEVMMRIENIGEIDATIPDKTRKVDSSTDRAAVTLNCRHCSKKATIYVTAVVVTEFPSKTYEKPREFSACHFENTSD